MATIGIITASCGLKSTRFARFRQKYNDCCSGRFISRDIKGTHASVRSHTSSSTPKLPNGSTWWGKFQRLFVERPYLASCGAAAILDASGDILCQLLQKLEWGEPKSEAGEEGQSDVTHTREAGSLHSGTGLDIGRILRFAVFGALLAAPLEVAWYRLLDAPKVVSLLKTALGSNALRVAVGQTLIDAVLFGPVMAIGFSMVMYTMKTIERESLASVNIYSAFEYAKKQFFTIWASECVFWFVL